MEVGGTIVVSNLPNGPAGVETADEADYATVVDAMLELETRLDDAWSEMGFDDGRLRGPRGKKNRTVNARSGLFNPRRANAREDVIDE